MYKIPWLCLIFLAPAAMAHDHRHHDAHVHGEARVDLAVDGAVVELALTAPGIGLLDFERPPANSAEKAALEQALAVLRKGEWALAPSAAGCHREQADAEAEGFAAAAASSAAGEHRHAGFTASLRLRCSQPSALQWLEVRLPGQFPGLQQVIVNALGPHGQRRSVLTVKQQRVELGR